MTPPGMTPPGITPSAARPPVPGRPVLSLAAAECRVLLRSPLTLVNAVLLPVAMGFGLLLLARDSGKDQGGDAAALQVLTLLCLTTYAGATTALVARRQEFALKRLRGTALSGPGIFAGLLTPYAVLGLLQAALLIGVTATVGGPPPARWWPLVLGVSAGSVAALTLAVATAAVTPLPELAQLTNVPVSLGLIGGGLWLVNAGTAQGLMFALPGVPIAELVRASWQPGGGPVVLSLAAIAGTTGVAALVASRLFRFDPRSANL